MADIRGIPATGWLLQGRLVANANAPAGFTAGRRYWPLALGVDCAVSPPIVYVLTANDGGAVVAVSVAAFSFAIDNLAP